MNLQLLQLGDSALPIGGYSHSWGLEAAIAQGKVGDASGLEHWVRDWLVHAAGPLEGVAVAAACRAAAVEDWSGVVAVNELLANSLAPSTLRHASRDMGEQLMALAESWLWAELLVPRLRLGTHCPGDSASLGQQERGGASQAVRSQAEPGNEEAWHHAVVFGALASVCGGTPEDAVAVFLHQATLGMISAGVRGIPIGHTHGQQILARLQADLQTLAEDLANRPLPTAGSCCPAYEVLCYDQSQLYTRLFRS